MQFPKTIITGSLLVKVVLSKVKNSSIIYEDSELMDLIFETAGMEDDSDKTELSSEQYDEIYDGVKSMGKYEDSL